MKKYKNLLVTLLFLLVSLKNYSATYTASGGAVTWSGFNGSCPFFNGATRLSFQPATGDILVIAAGCTVSVSGGIVVNNDITLDIYGQLKFGGAGDHLDLTAGSRINIYSGGSLSASSNSNQIKIGTGPAEWAGPATSVGPFTITNGSSTLPIELIEFYGNCISNGVQLNWSTASEIDNEYFLIEKSVNGTEWQYVAQILGNGTTGIVHHYIHTDYEVNNGGLIYYRLSQIDKNQTKTVFKAIDLNCSNNLPAQMMFFSNPASTELNIYFSVNDIAANSTIKIINNIGQIVMETKVDLYKGLNSFVFPIEINSGTYQVMFSSESISLPSQKLLVIN